LFATERLLERLVNGGNSPLKAVSEEVGFDKLLEKV
jgi:hypothetical protein